MAKAEQHLEAKCILLRIWLLCLQRMQSLRSMKEEDRTATEARYRQRLKEMDSQLKEVGKREKKYAQVERLQAKSQETCQRLQNDILAIKQQKVPPSS